jgi:hypothetical protein
MQDGDGTYGRKVIFLYPPTVLDDVVDALAQHEFEVYTCKDHEKLGAYLTKHPGALVFVNIDMGMKESEWEDWLRRRVSIKDGTEFGIVTYNDNKALAEKYLMGVGVKCGFIVLKIGAAKAVDILLRTLEANEARGKRKYVRSSRWEANAEYNVELNGSMVRGQVLDISCVGMTLIFENCVPPKVGAKISDIQLSLHGARVKMDAIVYGTREMEGGAPVYILIFTPQSMDNLKRDKIRTYVRRSLQEAFEKELAAL